MLQFWYSITQKSWESLWQLYVCHLIPPNRLKPDAKVRNVNIFVIARLRQVRRWPLRFGTASKSFSNNSAHRATIYQSSLILYPFGHLYNQQRCEYIIYMHAPRYCWSHFRGMNVKPNHMDKGLRTKQSLFSRFRSSLSHGWTSLFRSVNHLHPLKESQEFIQTELCKKNLLIASEALIISVFFSLFIKLFWNS